jgi:hypothetical protein
MKASALGVVVVGLVACGSPGQPRTVSMRMIGQPSGASVTIDDQFVGTLELVASRGVALPPGTHRVSVEAPGYFPWDRMIEAKEGQGPVRLRVDLVPIPD